MDDAQAIRAVLTGDRDRYRELIERHKKMVYAIAWSQLGDSELSEDAAQDTFIKAYSYLRTLREPSLFGSWIARITRNVCANLRRKVSREKAFVTDMAELPDVAQPAAARDPIDGIENRLWSSFARLPGTYREALTVFYIEGKSVEESARVLGIGESAMKTRLHRGRIALRENLEAGLEDALGGLQPSGRFTDSVMSVLPLSQAGLLGAGGLAGVLGKLSAGLWLASWPILMQVGSFGGLMWWFSRLETRAVKDTPQSQVHKALIRQSTIFMVILSTAMMLGMAVLARVSKSPWPLQALSILLVGVTFWLSIRQLRVNRTALAWFQLAMAPILLASIVGSEFFKFPFYVFVFVMPAMSLGTVFLSKDLPKRRDFNLFLRCAIGGLGTEDTGESSPPPRFTDRQLIAFVRFLGGHWLVKDYIEVDDRVVMILPPVERTFASMFSTLNGSRVSLARTGECTAEISAKDLASICRLSGRSDDKKGLETAVAGAVHASFRQFCANNLAGARSILTAQVEAVILDSKITGRNRRILIAFAVVTMLILVPIQFYLNARLHADLSAMQTPRPAAIAAPSPLNAPRLTRAAGP
jgi:RNA polymerase sigma factor (sigma-70 family)